MSEFSLPSWSDSFKAPSVVPSTVPTTPTTSFELPPGFFGSSSAPAATSVQPSWQDTLTAIGTGLDAAGVAYSKATGQLPPGSYGSGPYAKYMEDQEEKEAEEAFVKLLEKIRKNQTDPEYITEVLDPTKQADPQAASEKRMAGELLPLPKLVTLLANPFRG